MGLGIYNFTNNLEGVKYLLNHENTHEDVKYIEDMMPAPTPSVSNVKDGKVVLGFKNITDHAGCTTLIYLMKKELERTYDDKVYAIEVSRHDFEYFNIENAISTNTVGLKTAIDKLEKAKIVLIDLNDCKDYSMCSDLPPLDERKRSEEISNLVIKLGLLGKKAEERSQRLFGIFKV